MSSETVGEPTTAAEHSGCSGHGHHEAPEGAQKSSMGLWVGVAAAALLMSMMLLREVTTAWPMPSALAAWLAVTVGFMIQASPFLVFGVLLSAAIAAFLPAGFLARILPRKPLFSVPAAAAGGFLLPGCECASVPVCNSLMRKGMSPAPALAFLLAAPAINPVVLVATAVAFPNQPLMPWARMGASLLAAIVVAWIWLAWAKGRWLDRVEEHHHDEPSRLHKFMNAFAHDFVVAGGYLVVGAIVAAALNVFVPSRWLESIANNPWLAILALGLLAVVVAICSEADAFVAASLTQFSPTAQLAFMVVSPMVDVKLIAMQHGIFGPKFAWRFAPLTFVIAVAAAALVGTVVW